MATVVVAGRVDENVKREVDRIIERAGKTAADVIKDVWVNIYLTGELPTTKQQEEAFQEQRRRFQEFMAWRESLPPAPEWLVNLTDEELRDMMVEDMLEEERHFVGGDLYVPAAD
jgi:antitoxin component of RelBE/YafQ-DinJ toxin-antitoxin module